ncbi:hypothetical protein ITP53_26040 [Nonomuraea sp. K274]|uniref:Uncharacterized protein n=1 Tax=Nonomuraea cypriaca TaxID=1187855 RepID=A0A931AFF2_9ACTN|nr:hypothetical protein [Nonomuraea cypriaca]MBF8189130.1 hypothetical protein [Nonomuraea cypriaca]
MPNTAIFALAYPDPVDAPDGPTQMQALAESVETALDGIYAGIPFGGDVSVGGNLSTDGSLTVSGTSTLNNVNAGEVSTTLVESTGDISAGGDVYAHGLAVAYVVKAKVHKGSLVDTNTTSTSSYQNISGANLQSVPVVAGHLYKVEYQFAITSSVADDRIRYQILNGGDQLGSHSPIVRIETASTYTAATISFLWKAATTEVISNLNLAQIRYSGSGSVSTRVEVASFSAMAWDLGLAGAISNV